MCIYNTILNFFIYGFFGWCLEVAYAAIIEKKFVNRGFLNGAICPIYGIGVVCVVQILDKYAHNIILLYVMSVFITTALEWITGFLLEKLFHRKWWDYSDMPLNLNGYVCLLFSLMWGTICVFIVRCFHPIINKTISFIPVWLGSTISVILSILLMIDLYVTVSSILKMNKKLAEIAKMDVIAEELYKISDLIGNNISKNTLESVEKQTEIHQRITDIFNELKEDGQYKKEKIELVIKNQTEKRKKHYLELIENQSRIDKRIVNAFPKMKFSNYEKQFQELKNFIKNKENKKF